ncbi:hypothetical protein BDY17DRAFT_301372 [Neohortaea acidophila]|uniref:Uncharacterized protein n=1 Tax=Neohortaea acidophila TaxID=245834 RepID=A0A6A6PNT0_9PEZI|nr:uncharacterized protein BDY17DRAFT_301372 [Neohortaea acidophila]KAF2481456.1 hypothetical protein BDY17DRAFT_301372 [Neohortaea acidophila]
MALQHIGKLLRRSRTHPRCNRVDSSCIIASKGYKSRFVSSQIDYTYRIHPSIHPPNLRKPNFQILSSSTMRIFALLPVAFTLAAYAIPVAQPDPNALAAGDALPSPSMNLAKRAQDPTVKAVKKAIRRLNLDLSDTVDDLLTALGFDGTVADVDDLLAGLVGNTEDLVGEVEAPVLDLVDDLGLGGLTTAIDDLEEALGINPNSPISSLLKGLGLLPR